MLNNEPLVCVMALLENLLNPPLLASWWSAALVLAAAIAVPVFVHLWRRRDVPVVHWAAIRLLREAAEWVQRRSRWEEYSLLAVRLGLVLALVAAVTWPQPWLQQLAGQREGARESKSERVHRFLVFDTSLSMSYHCDGESCLERAKRQAIERLIRSASPGDAFTLVLMDSRPRVLGAAIDDLHQAAEQIATIQHTQGRADLSATMHLLANLVQDLSGQQADLAWGRSGRFARREVYFFTDAQAATWQQNGGRSSSDSGQEKTNLSSLLNIERLPLPTFFIDVGRTQPINWEVSNVTADMAWPLAGQELTFTATVRSYGETGGLPIVAGLWVGSASGYGSPDLRIQQRQQVGDRGLVAIGQQSNSSSFRQTTVEFRHRFPAAGTYAVQVRLEANDGLEADNALQMIVTVHDRLPILIVDGGEPDSHEPVPRSARYLRLALANPRLQSQPDVIDAAELAQQRPGAPGSLETYACLFLCNVPRLADREVTRLENHLRHGGGLVWFLGDQIDPAFYNERLYRDGQGILPVQVGAQVRCVGSPAASAEQVSALAAVEAPFELLNPGDYEHALLRDFRDHPDAGLLTARFQRYWRVRAASSAQTVLTFTAHPDPALVESVRGEGRVFVVPTAADLKWSSWPLNPSFLPLMQKMALSAVAGHRVSLSLPDAPEESDPRRLTEAELRSVFPEWPFIYQTECQPQRPRESASAADLSRVCLLLAMILLIVEMVLSITLSPGPGVPVASSSAKSWSWLGTPGRRPALWLGAAALPLLIAVAVLSHYAWSGELLGFLPGSWRSGLESALDVGSPLPGEGHTWQLRSRWLAPAWAWSLLAAGFAALTYAFYLLRRRGIPWTAQLALATARLVVCFIVLGLMLPAWVLSVQSFGRPVVVLAVDDSLSMRAYFPVMQRHLTDEQQGLLTELLDLRQRRVRLYRVGETAHRLGEFDPGQTPAARTAVQKLQPASTASRLGDSLRKIIDDGGAGAVLFCTDGAVTDGEPLRDAAAFARARAVPVYFIGVGQSASAREPRLQLRDLRAPDSLIVHDTAVFDFRLIREGAVNGQSQRTTDHGQPATVRVRLREKGSEEVLASTSVLLTQKTNVIPLRIEHQPARPGEITYVLDVVAEGDDKARRWKYDTVLEHHVTVLPNKPLRILYVEDCPRPEFRHLKSLLERQIDPDTKQPIIDLGILLNESDPGYTLQDRSAVRQWPAPAAWERLDLVILGDVAPEHIPAEAPLQLRNFVAGGGGLVVLAGPRHMPHAYCGTPLADLLPALVSAGVVSGEWSSAETMSQPTHLPPLTSHLLVCTPLARSHSFLASLCNDLTDRGEPIWWLAEGVRARPDADVLLSTPGLQPLLLDWPLGSGRCLFLGFQETWRWQALDGEQTYRRFWMQLLRHAARSRPEQVTLKFDRPPPYRQSETLRLLAYFPDDSPSAAVEERWLTVQKSRVSSQKSQVEDQRSVSESITSESWMEPLRPFPNVRGLYEARLENVAEGNYRFLLAAPRVTPLPAVECQVLGPPGELERVGLDEQELHAASDRGRWFKLENASDLLADLREGADRPLGAVRELSLWDHPLLWGLVLLLLACEWLVRRWKGIL